MIIDTFELEERKDQSELREWNWPWENQIFNILKYNPRTFYTKNIQRLRNWKNRRTSQTINGTDETVRVRPSGSNGTVPLKAKEFY